MSDTVLGTVTDTVVDAVIGELSNIAASLKLDLKHDDSTESDVSNPSTPCSPSGLRGVLLKDGTHGRRKHRSVSFSEDVVVETMVSNSPRKAKGKNKRYQPPRPRRFVTKLCDRSQNQGASSDSEIHYWGRNSYEQEELEYQEEVVFPQSVGLDRQTSSDSSSGEGGATVPDGSSKKKKKPKANKWQRKKMNAAKRAMAFDEDSGGMKDAWFEPSFCLRATSSEGSLAASGENTVNISKGNTKAPIESKDQNPNNGSENKAKSKAKDKTDKEQTPNNGDEQDKTIPLELQDHRTNSAVAFSNEVMFELDD